MAVQKKPETCENCQNNTLHKVPELETELTKLYEIRRIQN